MAEDFDLGTFIRATLIRALRTFAEGMLGAIGTGAIGITQVDWLGAASIGATAAILSILLAIATGLPETTPTVAVVGLVEGAKTEHDGAGTE